MKKGRLEADLFKNRWCPGEDSIYNRKQLVLNKYFLFSPSDVLDDVLIRSNLFSGIGNRLDGSEQIALVA